MEAIEEAINRTPQKNAPLKTPFYKTFVRFTAPEFFEIKDLSLNVTMRGEGAGGESLL